MATVRAYHNPIGDPCTCGLPRARHRVEHAPLGDPCKFVPKGHDRPCGLPTGRHYRKFSNTSRVGDGRGYYVGIDGEGQGRKTDGPSSNIITRKPDEGHRYVMLAWSNEAGDNFNCIEARPGERLTTKQCLEFIMSIPRHAKIFAFAFQYDLTKLLMDVPDEILFKLFRPDTRRRPPGQERHGPYYETWEGFGLNMVGSKFYIRRGKDRRVIWDAFKFYQKAFTGALNDWNESVPEKCPRCKGKSVRCKPCQDWPSIKADIDRLQYMKERRHEFDKEDQAGVRTYCFMECRYMAALTRKLIEACASANLHLRSYHGAGSVASAILKKWGIHEEERGCPDEMVWAVASAFFGGRFENSRLGKVLGLLQPPESPKAGEVGLWGLDISSAYPYQCVFLPCLKCGRWERTTRRGDIEGARQALVRYRLHPPPDGKPLPWAPFPFRTHDGSIAFPSQSGGGWVWRDEYVNGEKLFHRQVEFLEAWVYRCDCTHQPFAEVPQYYKDRLRIGKEGPGIILKLGTNALYGKTAQSLGHDPPYQSWPWAGMITSGTRAQMLELMALHKDLSNLIMIATDGAYTLEQIEGPKPRPTGTDGIYGADQKVSKPLGGWERKFVKLGMFAARPGMYFPLGDDVEDNDMRARGLGRKVMKRARALAIEGWERGARQITVANVPRFYGAKSSITRTGVKGAYVYKRAERYGQWEETERVLSFNPWPKRDVDVLCRDGQWHNLATARPYGIAANGDGDVQWRAASNPDGTLALRAMPMEAVSLPYDKALLKWRPGIEYQVSPEARALQEGRMFEEEQPSGEDMTDYIEDNGLGGS